MLTRHVPAAYRFFLTRRPFLFVMVAVACFACALVSSRLIVREDVRALLPAKPERLAESFTLLRDAPFMRRLTITVGGEGHDPAVLADMLAGSLRSEEIPHVMTGPGVTPDSAMLAALCGVMPSLLEPEDLAAIDLLLLPSVMRASLEGTKRLLLTPQGLALRSLVAKDPLNLRNVLFKRLAASGGAGFPGAGSARLHEGHIVDVSGRYALVIAEPAAPMSDSAASRRIMERVASAASSLPEGTEVIVAGAYRHTDANASAVKSDLAKVLPVSFVLLGVLFLVFIRSATGIYLFLLPAASLGFATAFAGIFMRSVSGIVIGFGSVVIGITADYAIHVYYALNGARDAPKALEDVSRPLCIGALTTLAAFAALLFSNIAAISQMAVFAMAGIAAAFFLGLFVLPHCLVSRNALKAGCFPVLEEPARNCVFRGNAARIIWFTLAVITAVSASFVPVSGDIRKLGYIPGAVLADEEKSARLWKTPRDGAMIVVRGGAGETGLEKALSANDAVWRIVSARTGETGKPPDILSLAPFMPSRGTQEERHAAWRNFWDEREDAVFAALAPLAAEMGFAPGAFTPFRNWVAGTPEFVTPVKLESFGLGVLVKSLLVHDEEGKTLVYSLANADFSMEDGTEAELRAAGAEIVSGEHFREDVSEATRRDFLAFCLFALLSVGGVLFVLFRPFSRWALSMLPLVSGVLAVTTGFHLFGFPMTVFHAAALPLIMGLAVDYGIFMVRSIENGRLVSTKKAVLLSGLTTLSGFGTLALAVHPALFSLGVTVGLGLAVAMLAALWGIPCLGTLREKT